MTLKERAASIDQNAVLSILVKYKFTGTERRHRYGDWSYCAYMDNEVVGEYMDPMFPDETVFVVAENGRLDRSGDALLYYDDDGEKYEIGSLSTANSRLKSQYSYDMAIILHPIVVVGENGDEWENYELVNYFHGIECFPDDEIIDACREYIQEWKDRKEQTENVHER